jgi:hypothetical protein
LEARNEFAEFFAAAGWSRRPATAEVPLPAPERLLAPASAISGRETFGPQEWHGRETAPEQECSAEARRRKFFSCTKSEWTSLVLHCPQRKAGEKPKEIAVFPAICHVARCLRNAAACPNSTWKVRSYGPILGQPGQVLGQAGQHKNGSHFLPHNWHEKDKNYRPFSRFLRQRFGRISPRRGEMRLLAPGSHRMVECSPIITLWSKQQ